LVQQRICIASLYDIQNSSHLLNFLGDFNIHLENCLDQPDVSSYRDGVAVIQLFFFVIYLALGVVLCWRHGFRRSDGWILVVTLSILRVLAASFQLATINTPHTTTYGGALICQGIGLAPLILLNFGLFIRM
jgi:hypothetical protein